MNATAVSSFPIRRDTVKHRPPPSEPCDLQTLAYCRSFILSRLWTCTFGGGFPLFFFLIKEILRKDFTAGSTASLISAFPHVVPQCSLQHNFYHHPQCLQCSRKLYLDNNTTTSAETFNIAIITTSCFVVTILLSVYMVLYIFKRLDKHLLIKLHRTPERQINFFVHK